MFIASQPYLSHRKHFLTALDSWQCTPSSITLAAQKQLCTTQQSLADFTNTAQIACYTGWTERFCEDLGAAQCLCNLFQESWCHLVKRTVSSLYGMWWWAVPLPMNPPVQQSSGQSSKSWCTAEGEQSGDQWLSHNSSSSRLWCWTFWVSYHSQCCCEAFTTALTWSCHSHQQPLLRGQKKLLEDILKGKHWTLWPFWSSPFCSWGWECSWLGLKLGPLTFKQFNNLRMAPITLTITITITITSNTNI